MILFWRTRSSKHPFTCSIVIPAIWHVNFIWAIYWTGHPIGVISCFDILAYVYVEGSSCYKPYMSLEPLFGFFFSRGNFQIPGLASLEPSSPSYEASKRRLIGNLCLQVMSISPLSRSSVLYCKLFSLEFFSG
jgi:hypothetical protein